MTLRSNEKFIIESGGILFVKQKKGKGLKMETSSGGVWGGLKRTFSGEKFFINKVSGPENGSVKVTFGGSMPGDTIAIVLKPGESYNISAGSFLASSENLEIKSTFKAKGIFTGEGAFLTTASNKSNKDQLLFLSCYGKINKVSLTEREEYLVDNGAFLACKKEYDFETTKIGGTKSLIFGGEGLLMKFRGPCELYTQNRDFNSFANKIATKIPNRRR